MHTPQPIRASQRAPGPVLVLDEQQARTQNAQQSPLGHRLVGPQNVNSEP
jgi:hypothetical protein